MLRKFFFFCSIIFNGCSLFAQQTVTENMITGKLVSAENGQPLPNITVLAIRNKTTVITNELGVFRIPVTLLPDTLVFSHIGYKIERIPLNGKENNFSIALKPSASQLEEVIVNTGYQRVKPNEINGSVVVIDNQTLNRQAGTNILERLNGVTSGLAFNPGYSNGNAQNKTNINIRGLSTINGPLDPLIVLDNFIYEGNINNINPNDIESITVLKDASAASIWGARAGNGVIVITTKKGRFNQKLKVEISSNIIVTQKPRLSLLPEMSVNDYINVEEYLFNQGYFNETINQGYQALTPAVEVFLKRRDRLISSNDSALQINTLKGIDSKSQYAKYFYQKAVTQQHAINLRGGTDNLAWLVSGTYDRNIDNLNASYEKMNFRFNNTYRPIKNLQLDVGVYYTSSKSTSGEYDYNTVTNINGRYVPYIKFSDNNGTPLSVASLYRNQYVDTAGAGKLLDWKYYPLEDYKHNRGITRIEEIVANAGLNYHLFKPLQINIQYQYHQQRSNTENNADLESFNTRNTINLFSRLDRSTGVVNYIVPVGDILNLYNSNRRSQNIRVQLNFDKSLGNHSVVAIAGAEIREVINNGNSSIYYGYNKDPLFYSNIDFVNSYPTFITGNYRTISGPASLSNTINRFISVYSNFSYVFKQKYTLSTSARKDGSNILGVKTNDKWKPLWSAGMGWHLSKEKFYRMLWMPYLKMRITYGYSGNVDLSRSALPLANYGTDNNTNLPVALINTINNPGLKWEQIDQFNIGIEFYTKNRLVSGSIDYYHKKGTGLYGQTPYDYTTWGLQNTIIKNVANMKSNGVDIVLNTKNIDKTFKWATSLLYNYNSNKTTKYFDNSSQSITSLLGGGRFITPVIDKPLYAIAAYKWGGLNNEGNPQGFVNGNPSTDYSGIFSEATKKGPGSDNIIYVGSSIPASFGSLINTFSWKQIEVSFNLSYKFGYYFRRPSLSYSGLVSGGVGHKEYANRWQKPGDELITNVPSFAYPENSSRDNFYSLAEINVLKGDHIRFQYVNLSYSIYKKNKAPFDQIQVYVNMANLGIIWRANSEKIDPDNPGIVPVSKSFAFGVRVNL